MLVPPLAAERRTLDVTSCSSRASRSREPRGSVVRALALSEAAGGSRRYNRMWICGSSSIQRPVSRTSTVTA
jgi:hypothetical protein